MYISDFHSVRPRYRLTQEQSVKNMVEIRLLINQKRVLLGLDEPLSRKRIEARVARFGLANSKIKERGTEISDYTLSLPDAESELSFFKSAQVPLLENRMTLYAERVQEVFSIFYPQLENATLPEHLIHVSCTGYIAPSPAQKMAAQWKKTGSSPMTTVTHAYHMGCYASLPALRMAQGFHSVEPSQKVDIVHNEICSLHVDPLSLDPEQMVVQSLFADGHIKYSMTGSKPHTGTSGFKVCALLEEMVPNTSGYMTWSPSSTHFAMSLSREVPHLLSTELKPYVAKLFQKANLSPAEPIVFAIHPGGPKIIEAVETLLELKPNQTAESHEILAHRGNMSSATLPHIWEAILKNPLHQDGKAVVSLAFGPGITMSGGVFRICRS